MTNVPQKAKDVLVEPVVLLIDNVKVLVTCVPGVQLLHASPPVKVAPTNVKSLEVHRSGLGNVVVVCATAVPEKSNVKN